VNWCLAGDKNVVAFGARVGIVFQVFELFCVDRDSEAADIFPSCIEKCVPQRLKPGNALGLFSAVPSGLYRPTQDCVP
jgi:hypothetical protein